MMINIVVVLLLLVQTQQFLTCTKCNIQPR